MGYNALAELPGEVDAIVSLCRLADDRLPTGIHALGNVLAVLPGAHPNADFRAALRRLHRSTISV